MRALIRELASHRIGRSTARPGALFGKSEKVEVSKMSSTPNEIEEPAQQRRSDRW